MPILRTIKFFAYGVERFLMYRVFSLDDTPHRLALGVAIGIFVTWTPTIGLQMVLTVALAWLLGANKLVGVPFVWLSNPATIIPVYGPNYLIGCWILDRPADGWHKVIEAIRFQGGLYERVTEWYDVTRAIFWELWVGSLVVALVLGVMSYFTMYRMIVVYRTRWKHKLDAIYHHRARRKQKNASAENKEA
ncbi:MAG: DUF2062 domain-containing protein [Phycisphaerae bacterium]|nr:DUF2062 domain-containing protein [Phycisphaerae bacterium]